MKPTWSLKSEVQKRAQRESIFEWAKSKDTTPLPVYVREKKVKWNVGWANFYRSSVIREFLNP